MSYITKPFAWLILFFYQQSGSYALALVLFSLVIKLVLFPFFMKGKKGMMKMSRLAPKVKELEKKYQDNKQKYSMEVQKLYKEENVSPLSGCIWNLIPFPFLIILYSLIRHPLSKIMGLSTDAINRIVSILTGLGVKDVADPTTSYGEMTLAQQAAEHSEKIIGAVDGFVNLNMNMWGLNLSQTPRFLFFKQPDAWQWATVGLFLIPIVSGLFALLQMLISQKLNPPMTEGQNNKSMLITMPLISVWIGYAMPASMSIYWIANSFFSIIQDWFATKYYMKKFDAEDAVKNAERARLEAEKEEKRRQSEERKALEGPKAAENTSKKKLQKKEREEREKAEREYKERTGQLKKKDDARPYARGRAYDPDRFKRAAEAEEEKTELADILPEADEAPAPEPAAGGVPDGGFDEGDLPVEEEIEEYEDDNDDEIG
ncbi:MAG: membrane protein insertase YidC [Oscillospiraceae bacterium]|jgi:YidC/Oxa1 family membrane protein insertase